MLDTGQWVLKGILSKGGTKCYGPFLYTRVPYYADWIVATTAKQGMPISPILVSSHVAFEIPTEVYKGLATPWIEAKKLNLTEPLEAYEVPPQAGQPQGGGEGDTETPGPLKPQGRVLPVYYDYYSGEILPISSSAFGLPQGHIGMLISASLLLHLLTFWVMSSVGGTGTA